MSDNAKKMPLVSVIIPVYKVEQYLHECVDSVLAQTYANIEVILVDDGSPDGCSAICDEYAAKDCRVRVIHKENGGLSDARNAGMKIAYGEYWAFVDSDDVVHPQMIESLMEPILADSNLKLSTCGFRRFSNDTELDFSKAEFQSAQRLSLTEFMHIDCWMTAWGKIYHKTLFDGIVYPKGRFHEDEFVTYKLIYRAEKIVFSSDMLYLYRQREGSIMSNFSKKRAVDSFEAYSERIAFFKAEPVLYDLAILQMLNFYVTLNTKKYKKINCADIGRNAKVLLEKCDKSGLTLKTRFKLFLKMRFLWLFVFRKNRLEN